MLEVTENMVLADPVRVGDVLAQLGELGLGLSLDDFGTGFSSLTHLKSLPVGEVKIDRSFVGRMTTDPVDAAIVQATIQLAHSIGIRVVAEGIEDQVTWSSLVANRCELVQGYALSRPLPALELDALLRAQPLPNRPPSRPSAADAALGEPPRQRAERAETAWASRASTVDAPPGDRADARRHGHEPGRAATPTAATGTERPGTQIGSPPEALRDLTRAEALAPDDGRRDRRDRRAHDPRRVAVAGRLRLLQLPRASTSTARSSRRCRRTWTPGARTRAGRACWAARGCTRRSRSG